MVSSWGAICVDGHLRLETGDRQTIYSENVCLFKSGKMYQLVIHLIV
jgi:hypothetical protein